MYHGHHHGGPAGYERLDDGPFDGPQYHGADDEPGSHYRSEEGGDVYRSHDEEREEEKESSPFDELVDEEAKHSDQSESDTETPFAPTPFFQPGPEERVTAPQAPAKRRPGIEKAIDDAIEAEKKVVR